MSTGFVEAALQTDRGLPPEPFRHASPTAIVLLDLDTPLAPKSPTGTRAEVNFRDALVVVRLHDQPLGMLYVNGPLDELSANALADMVWARFQREIRHHASQVGCMTIPEDAHHLVNGIGADDCPFKQPAQPSGSFALIVPTGGRPAQLRRCLASLLALPGPEYEIIVVDNQPPCAENRLAVDEAVAVCAHQITYVEEPRPGSSVARNRGLAETEADIVVFTDDDVVVDADWLRWLVEPFTATDVGATTGMVLPLELETPAQKAFEQYSGFSKGMERSSFDLESDCAKNRLLYPFWGTPFGSGNSMAFRREPLVAAGGFDPALGAGSRALAGADIEAMSAVVLRGQRLVYEPRALCWHEHRRGDDALRRQMFNYGVGCTAIMTKALLHDRRFLGAAARSLPLAFELGRHSRRRSDQPTIKPPRELAQLQWKGMLRGPARYARSIVWSRRLGLDRVVNGDKG